MMTDGVKMLHGSNCRAIPAVKDIEEYKSYLRAAFEMAVEFDKMFIDSRKPSVSQTAKTFNPLPLPQAMNTAKTMAKERGIKVEASLPVINQDN